MARDHKWEDTELLEDSELFKRRSSQVHLEEVVASLTAYATGICNQPVILTGSEKRSDTTTGLVQLPLKITQRTREDSLLHYKILTTLQVGILKYATQLINIDDLPNAWQKRLRSSPGKHVQGYMHDAVLPRGYDKSFQTIFQLIEFGRIRHRLGADYPALDDDIDAFLGRERIKDLYDPLFAKRECIRMGKQIYDMTESKTFSDEHKRRKFEDMVNETVCVELGYLLLFSNEQYRQREKDKSLPKTQEIYSFVFPTISQRSATRSDSVRLTIDVLDRFFYNKKDDEEKKDTSGHDQDNQKDNTIEKKVKKKKSFVKKHTPPNPKDQPSIEPLPATLMVLVPSLSYLSSRQLDEFLVLEEKTSHPPKLFQSSEFKIDEWDKKRKEYIHDACTVKEKDNLKDAFSRYSQEKRELVFAKDEVRYAFSPQEVDAIRGALESLKPEGKVTTYKLRSGDLDFDAWSKYRIEKRLGLNPQERFYKRTERKDRDVAQLILWDVGGSGNGFCSKAAMDAKMRIIDMGRYGLVHYAAALQELGDDLTILAYNSRGRDQVNIYPLVRFGTSFSIAGLQDACHCISPQANNHDGAALRHALYNYLLPHSAKTRILIHISDGVPNDTDFSASPDNRGSFEEYSGDYALADVKKALEEYVHNDVLFFGISFAYEQHREVLQQIWGSEYKMLKTPYALGKKIAQVIAEKTL